MLVIDASVLVVALADHDEEGDLVRARLRGEQLAAPELVDLEVASVLRKQAWGGARDDRRARLALHDLARFPLIRAAHGPLLPGCWELRHNLTVYDAAYVALAETLRSPLLTADRRLAQATGPRCLVELVEPAR